MEQPGPLDRLSQIAGIEPAYYDILGARHEASPATKAQLLSGLGFDVSSEAALESALAAASEAPWREALAPLTVRFAADGPLDLDIHVPERRAGLRHNLEITLESGERDSLAFLPRDLAIQETRQIGGERIARRTLRIARPLPPGYHRLILGDLHAEACTLAVGPRRCYLPPALEHEERRVWGLSAHLYTLRSQRNWGIGDFTDLAALSRLVGEAGGAAVAANPFHALFPGRPGQASPYSPSSRLFLNWLYIDPDAAAKQGHISLAKLDSEEIVALRAAKLVDYQGVAAAKRSALEALFADFRTRQERGARDKDVRAFGEFAREGGEWLTSFACFSVLEEMYATHWQNWPAALRAPGTPALQQFSRAHVQRVMFHEYLQYLADRQLAEAAEAARAAGQSIGVIRDLALGVEPAGADAWLFQGSFAHGLRCGAPPDDFHPEGQEWGILPLNPLSLRRDYTPFIAALRANMRHCGGLRIDHVIGFARQFLVPLGCKPSQGAYVRFPKHELFALMALESRRNQCLVVGEDLGTVPEGFRDELNALHGLGYSILYFERESSHRFKPPQSYRRRAVACAASHDLPTIAGFFSARDVRLRGELRIYSREEADKAFAARKADRARLIEALHEAGILLELPERPEELAPEALCRAVHAFLASSAAQVFLAQADDLAGEEEQINVPGTVAAYPNWRRKLSLAIDSPRFRALLAELARACANQGRGIPRASA